MTLDISQHCAPHPKPPVVEKPSPRAATRTAPPRKRRPRTAAEQRAKFDREYGGEAHLDFVQRLPCCACGVVGYSVAAHVGNRGAGTGRKADASQLAPLCCDHWKPRRLTGVLYRREGCHERSHRIGQRTFEREMDVDLAACAEETQRAFSARAVEGRP